MIRHSILSLLLLIVLLGCQQSKTQQNSEAETVDQPQKEDLVITYEEYSGTEPTKPEETEFYEPIVPEVKPYAQNGAPSDAIILFNGSSLDNWVSSSDGSKAQWTLNDDGSMTVKNRT